MHFPSFPIDSLGRIKWRNRAKNQSKVIFVSFIFKNYNLTGHKSLEKKTDKEDLEKRWVKEKTLLGSVIKANYFLLYPSRPFFLLEFCRAFHLYSKNTQSSLYTSLSSYLSIYIIHFAYIYFNRPKKERKFLFE